MLSAAWSRSEELLRAGLALCGRRGAVLVTAQLASEPCMLLVFLIHKVDDYIGLA